MELSSSSYHDSIKFHIQTDLDYNAMMRETEFFMPLQDEPMNRQAFSRVDSNVFEDSADDRSRTTSVSFPNSSETLFPVDFNLTTQIMYERINGGQAKNSTHSPTSTSGRSSVAPDGNRRLYDLDHSRSSSGTRDSVADSYSSRKCYELDRSRSSVGTYDPNIESDYVVGESLEQEETESVSDVVDEVTQEEDVDECIFDLEL